MAKFCPSCGTQLDDAAQFCASCGTKFEGVKQTEEFVQVEQPTQSKWQSVGTAPEYGAAESLPPKKNNKIWLILGGILIALLLCALAAVGIWSTIRALGDTDTITSTIVNEIEDNLSGTLDNTNDATSEIMGYWLYSSGESIELLHLMADGTFETDIIDTAEMSHDIMTGSFSVDGSSIVMTNVRFNNSSMTDDDLSMSFVLSDDGWSALIDGATFVRVEDDALNSVIPEGFGF